MKRLTFRKKRLEITIHAISWLLVFIFPIMLTEGGSRIDWMQYLRHGIVPLCSFILFYANYLYLVPHYLFRGKGGRFLLSNVLSVVLLAVVIHFAHMLLWEPPRPDFVHGGMPVPRPPRALMFWGSQLVMLAFVAGLSTAIRVSLRWRDTEERLAQAERAKTEAELKNLKSQLNPHFLLNTLNNIYALIAFDSTRAQEAVQELGKMLRYVLYDNRSAKVTLARELDFIANYISLMRIRLPKSVQVSIRLDAGEKPLFISPLIFISLIENAFKHGVSPTESSFICITVCGHTDGRVTCEILNSNYPKNGEDKSGSGIGLMQVSRRLEMDYPGQYEWKKETSDGGTTYLSSLTIQTAKS